MKEVWPNESVEEANLAQHIFILRRAFGESADHPQYIETIPRRGYRFLGSVKEICGAYASKDVALVSQPTYSLAVLPFVNGNTDPKIEYLSDSITATIINDLSQLSKIHVRPRSTVFRYKNKDFDVQQVGRKLAVHNIVTGTVQMVDKTLLIGVELVDVAEGWQVYGKTYKVKSHKLSKIHEHIARDITAALGLTLSEG